MTAGRPVPARDDDTWGYFEAAARGELVVCACSSCGAVLHLPRPYCKVCGSMEVEWRTVEGRGRLWSWTTVHHSVHPGFETPYTVVVVELDDPAGVRLVGHLPGEPDLSAGMPMAVAYESLGDVVIPTWAPAGPGPEI